MPIESKTGELACMFPNQRIAAERHGRLVGRGHFDHEFGRVTSDRYRRNVLRLVPPRMKMSALSTYNSLWVCDRNDAGQTLQEKVRECFTETAVLILCCRIHGRI